jgi:uncharacterized protein
VPKPVVFAVPAEVELSPAPIPEHWIIEGRPDIRSGRVASAADGTAAAFVWSSTAGRFHWHYSVDEFLHILSGEVFVTDENGKSRRLGAGDLAFFPAGASSIWHVPHEVKKIAVCRHSMPRLFGLGLRVWNKLARLFKSEEQGGDLAAPEANSGTNSERVPAAL